MVALEAIRDFLKEWGGILSLVVAGLAYLNSSKAVRLAETKQQWEARDRGDEEARRQWCAAKAETLSLHTKSSLGFEPEIAIEVRQIPWAKWGEEQGFFSLATASDGTPCLRRRQD